MNQKKGAFELSASFLVIIIIAVVVLALGTTFLYRFVGGGEKAGQQLEASASASMAKQASEGARVTISQSSAYLRLGEEQTFTISVLNVGEQAEFFLDIGISGEKEEPLPGEKWIMYSHEPFPLDSAGKHQEKVLITVPSDASKGTYIIRAKVFQKKEPQSQYGPTQRFQLYVTEEGKQEKKQEAETLAMEEECLKELSCDYYIVFVPVGAWQSQELFEEEVKGRALFLVDISPLKFKKTGILTVPLDFTKGCNLAYAGQESARDHMEIKSCADKYADRLGISYERAVGLSSEYTGGKAFFNSKTVYASLGFGGSERPGVVAHEIGHTYSLCDEYDFPTYQTQNTFLRNSCQNQWPQQCSPGATDCLGNTPVFREYGGLNIRGVCSKNTKYSVMGFSTGAECGYDATGGYQAIEEGLS